MWIKTNRKEKTKIKTGVTDSRGNIENSGHRRGFYGISGKVLTTMGEHASEGDEGICICSVLLVEVRLLLSHRNWEIGSVSFGDCISKWGLPGP